MRIQIKYTEHLGNSYTNALEFDERKMIIELVAVISKFIPIKPQEMILKTNINDKEVKGLFFKFNFQFFY
jgi:hypothetical protein